MEAKTISAYCVACNAECYRSTRPLIPGKDKADPSVFQPVGYQTTAPTNGPALCDRCGGQLQFIPTPTVSAEGIGRRPSPEDLIRASQEEQRLLKPPTPLSGAEALAPPPAPVVREVFRADAGEKILHVAPARGGVFVLTSARVLFIPTQEILT